MIAGGNELKIKNNQCEACLWKPDCDMLEDIQAQQLIKYGECIDYISLQEETYPDDEFDYFYYFGFEFNY